MLFERSPRGVRLTPAGEALVAHAHAVVARLADAREELGAIAGGRAGRIRLGSFPTATSAFAAGAVERFHALYPGVEIDFADGEPHENLARLRARELDLAIVFEFDSWSIGMDYDGRILCADDGFDYVDLFDDPFYLVLRRDDPLAARKRIGLERIAEAHPGRTAVGPDLRLLCNRCGFEPRFDSKYRTTDFSAFQSLVAAGLGVTLMPAPGLRVDSRRRRTPAARPSAGAPREAGRTCRGLPLLRYRGDAAGSRCGSKRPSDRVIDLARSPSSLVDSRAGTAGADFRRLPRCCFLADLRSLIRAAVRRSGS